jgi:hypothetical protein
MRAVPLVQGCWYVRRNSTAARDVTRCHAYANSYRAQVERLLGSQEMQTEQDEDGIRRDLESLESTLREKLQLRNVCV